MDDDAYEVFYDHYAPFVRSFIARRVASADVDDLAAEVFVIAWRRRADVPEDALPWLYRTARNVIGTRYRSDSRREALHSRMRAVPFESPEDPADIAGRRDRVIETFAALSDDDQELLLLVAWEGLTTSEVAQVLGLSPGTVGVRLHRARQRLATGMNVDQDITRGDG